MLTCPEFPDCIDESWRQDIICSSQLRNRTNPNSIRIKGLQALVYLIAKARIAAIETGE